MSKTMIKRLIGAGIGAIVALMILFLGFWRTLLIAVLAGLGWWVTGSRQIPPAVTAFISKLLHLHQ